MVLGKTLESPMDCKKSKLGNPKGNQPWIFIRRTDAEAEAPILWPSDVKSWLTGCWEKLKVKGEEGGRRWDGWIASPTQWTWIWTNSGRWWRMDKPCVLQSMGIAKSQTQLSNWTTICYSFLGSKVLSFLAGPLKRECCGGMISLAPRTILLLRECPVQLDTNI